MDEHGIARQSEVEAFSPFRVYEREGLHDLAPYRCDGDTPHHSGRSKLSVAKPTRCGGKRTCQVDEGPSYAGSNIAWR